MLKLHGKYHIILSEALKIIFFCDVIAYFLFFNSWFWERNSCREKDIDEKPATAYAC